MTLEEKGMMIVLSSPSGAGKTTLTKKLKENNNNFHISISHTTRKPRSNEINGKDYYFVNQNEFDLLKDKGELLEYAKVFNKHPLTSIVGVSDPIETNSFRKKLSKKLLKFI